MSPAFSHLGFVVILEGGIIFNNIVSCINKCISKDFESTFGHSGFLKGGNLFTENDIIKNDGRPYIKCQFIHNGKCTEEMRFSGETDFNFSAKKKRELCRSRYEHYKRILERDLIDEGVLEIYLEMLKECSQKHHSQDNISIMFQSGNMQGAKGAIGLDRLDVWLLILDMKYRCIWNQYGGSVGTYAFFKILGCN